MHHIRLSLVTIAVARTRDGPLLPEVAAGDELLLHEGELATEGCSATGPEPARLNPGADTRSLAAMGKIRRITECRASLCAAAW